MAKTLNDFGDAGVARVQAILDQHARDSGTPKEAWYAYFNETGHLPQTTAEFVAFLNKMTKYGVARRDPATGAITPIMPGVNPDPRLTAVDRGGFAHNITNAEDSQVQRFQQVDDQGNIFGGSWDPEYNRTHFDAQGRPIGQATQQITAEAMQRSASGMDASNYVAPAGGGFVSVVNGVPNYFATQNEAENDFNRRGGAGAGPSATGPGTAPGATPPSPSAAYPPGVDPGSLPGADARRTIVDANAYGNQQDLQARVDEAIRQYALARTQEQRNQAFLDLQRWQTELNKVQSQQKTVTDMATALLSAATTLGSRPQDYVKFNQAVSGGTDILDQITGKGSPVAAFGGPTGQIQPGSVWDLLGRMGLQYPATPATPAGVQPGATNPANPDLPAVPVPGTPGVPGALQPGATGGSVPGSTQAATGLPPSYEQALRELDQAAGGQWGGNRADKNAVAQAWWAADPSRRSRPMPAVAWG